MKITIEANSLDELFKIVDGMRASKKDDSILNASIMYLGLGAMARNRLENENITTVGDLVQYTEDDLYKIPKLGRKLLYEIKGVLALKGLYLKGGFV